MTEAAVAQDSTQESKVDRAFLERAISRSNKNVLRMALYQQTQDESLLNMKVERRGHPGSPFIFPRVARESYPEIEQKAIEYMLSPGPKELRMPTKEEGYRMMEAFVGVELSESYKQFGWEDLGFEEFSRAAEWSGEPPVSEAKQKLVTIVGAGFSGIICAIQLDRLGIPYRIVERHAGFGGTWHFNDYPEARVDITTFIYQFKFELGYQWKSHFATQGELVEYIDYLVDKYNLRDKIELNTAVTDAVWDDAAKKWNITLEKGGETESYSSDFVISAAGLFSTPKLPDIKGIERYQGRMWHTTAWDHSFDMTGKRVAVIGTGSTGSQLVRGVADKAAHLTVYQRTPNWVNPIKGYRDKVTPELRWLLDNMPAFRNWYTFSHLMSQMQMEDLTFIDKDWQAKGGKINELNDALREGLTDYIRHKCDGDEELFEKLVPDYAPLSRRLVVDNDWYDTLMLDNVELETTGIETFTETGITTKDGKHQEFDLVVLSAGFQVDRYLFPVEYVGREGRTLGDLWNNDGARAHLTMYLPGFPNFAMMYGPNAGTTSGSLHSWIEILSRHICKLIGETIERGDDTFEVTEEAYTQYNDELDKGLEKMLLVPEKAGGGYYLNAHGRPGVSSPWKLDEYFAYLAEVRPDEYKFS